ncbi:MAG: hypothetical protein ABIH65_00475 [Nanoarchaeota archaeon]
MINLENTTEDLYEELVGVENIFGAEQLEELIPHIYHTANQLIDMGSGFLILERKDRTKFRTSIVYIYKDKIKVNEYKMDFGEDFTNIKDFVQQKSYHSELNSKMGA